jgi:uncharacterized protein (TIGR02265 family)
VRREGFETFAEPVWDAPLELRKVLREIPREATIAGMFIEPLAVALRAAGEQDGLASERYASFRFYPLTDHVNLLIRGCDVLHSGARPRDALRKLGRSAPTALLSSTLGKVTLGSVQGVVDMVRAIANTYSVSLRPSQAAVIGEGPRHVLVELASVHYFLDSHHVGVFEGVLRLAKMEGTVKIHKRSETSGDILCSW